METATGKAKGGVARAAKLSPERRREIAQKGVSARRELASLPRVTHGSVDHPLVIGAASIQCYVLESGMRVLSQRGMQTGIGMSTGGGATGEQRLASFALSIASKSNENKDLMASSTLLSERLRDPIKFNLNGTVGHGYEATVLADLCDVVLAARAAGLLMKQQLHIADQCELLVRGFARVGIIALVDEATGYQKDRARDALAQILEAFVAKELRPYIRKFPAAFYEEMFRLRGLPFDPSSVKRPPYFGHLTNDIVYRRLAPGVWKELKTKVQKSANGRPRHHLHRMLTADVGDPRLKELITRVVTVMQLSDRWPDFKAKLDRIVPAYNDTLELPLELENDTGHGL